MISCWAQAIPFLIIYAGTFKKKSPSSDSVNLYSSGWFWGELPVLTRSTNSSHFYQLLCPPKKVEQFTPQLNIEPENGGSKEIRNLEINIFSFRC